MDKNLEALIRRLREMKPEIGGTVCLGCGYEHKCSIHGYAVLVDAIARLSMKGESHGR